MDKIKAYVASHIVSWIIEIGAIAIVATITISEVRKTNEQTRAMLTSISAFAAERQEAVGDAIDSIADEAQNIRVDGRINLKEVNVDTVRNFFIKEEDEEHD